MDPKTLLEMYGETLHDKERKGWMGEHAGRDAIAAIFEEKSADGAGDVHEQRRTDEENEE